MQSQCSCLSFRVRVWCPPVFLCPFHGLCPPHPCVHCISCVRVSMRVSYVLPYPCVCLTGISIVASVLTIVCMAFDRYFAIRHPMKNRQIFTVRRVKQLILVTWFLAAILVIPILVVRKVTNDVHFFPIIRGNH